MNTIPTQPSLLFFTGPMACGKTLELVRHLQIFQQQNIPTVCLRPSSDTRTTQVQSRSGLLYEATMVDPNDSTLLKEIMQQHTIIGVDEIQLFSPSIVEILIQQLHQGKTILASGLDTDFRGEMFPTSQALMSVPETTINRLRAVCSVCRQYNATRTQRLRDGQPVSKQDPQVLIEGAIANITYEARCLKHHQI